MNLAVFDIDGTLLRSVELDDTCFVRALAEVLGIEGVASDWTRYQHPTDSGLTREIVRRHAGRDPTDEEIELVCQRCCQLLRRVVLRSRSAIREVAGAARLLSRLRHDGEWRAAIASGSWQATAQIKLQAAGIDADGLPAAFADDSHERSKILSLAIQRAGQQYEVGGFRKVVYVGDGVWDVAAARQQGVAFLGLGVGSGTESLAKAGATGILSDFTQTNTVFKALDEARIPRPPDGSGSRAVLP